MWPFTRSTAAPVAMPRLEPVIARPGVEKRSTAGYTAMLLGAREAYISGRSGLGELTSTVQACISLWEAGLGLASVKGAPVLGRREMAIVGRSLALRGESLWLIRGDRLIPASDWDIATKDAEPKAYRLSISETGGGSTTTALAGEVLHFRIGVDSAAPWAGSSPLRRSSLTASLLQAIEGALEEVFQNAPLGSSIVPYPEAPDVDLTAMARDFRGRRGRVLMRESVNVSAAGGPTPQTDWKPQGVPVDLQQAMTVESLAAARDGIAFAYGVLPAWFTSSGQGPAIRECQRHLAQWVLQPICELIAEECTIKLGGKVELDCMTPTQSFDAGGSARALATIVGALTEAKGAGLSDAAVGAAFSKLDWQD